MKPESVIKICISRIEAMLEAFYRGKYDEKDVRKTCMDLIDTALDDLIALRKKRKR